MPCLDLIKFKSTYRTPSRSSNAIQFLSSPFFSLFLRSCFSKFTQIYFEPRKALRWFCSYRFNSICWQSSSEWSFGSLMFFVLRLHKGSWCSEVLHFTKVCSFLVYLGWLGKAFCFSILLQFPCDMYFVYAIAFFIERNVHYKMYIW